MSELPTVLAREPTRVTFRNRQEDAYEELKGEVQRKFVHLLFTETRGGTELGIPLDEQHSNLSDVDWEARKGILHIEGELKLDGVPVRCIADLHLENLEGTGKLELC